jgi:hypothetical protein
MSLLYIGQLITIYLGFILLFTGIIGNGISIFIFSSAHNYQRIPCIFYLLVQGINNVFFILINLTSRIVSAGFGIDATSTSVFWCKARYFFIGFFSLNSFSCACLATIDQFFVTSQNVRLRQLSKIQWAHRIVLILVIFWFVVAVVTNFGFFDISTIIAACVPINTAYALFFSIAILVLLAAVPISVIVVFGSLTYRNIRRTAALIEQQADRQLVKMILIQVFLVIISVTPYCINGIYSLATAQIVKDEDQQQKEYFSTTVVGLLCYLYYAVYLLDFY